MEYKEGSATCSKCGRKIHLPPEENKTRNLSLKYVLNVIFIRKKLFKILFL